VIDYVVCRTYTPRSSQQSDTVPVLPFSMQQSAISQSRDIPIVGHQGISKTLQPLQESAYWVGMSHDVAQYCKQCTVCQQTKMPAPTPAPMKNVPIGWPWQMLAADISEVPVSRCNNRYFLVILDYFTRQYP